MQPGAGGIVDFQLNDEQLQLKKTVSEFASREIGPHVMKWDEAGEFPLSTVKELGKLGLLGIIFPTEYGGAGMGYVEYVTAIEELSRVDGSRRNHCCRAHVALLESYFRRRKRSAKEEICKQACNRRIYWRMGIDGTIFRVGRGQCEDDRGAQGQQLGFEWDQDFLH